MKRRAEDTSFNMDNRDEYSLFENLEQIVGCLEKQRLADVGRFISFQPAEQYKKHAHIRIEINYVKKGSCIIELPEESISFKEGELMIICSNVLHAFQAGPNGCTLMQLEFLPEIFNRVQHSLDSKEDELSPCNIFSSKNDLIKIVNNIPIVRAVEQILSELRTKGKYYQHLIIMHYAELLILIYRHLTDNYIPLCSNRMMKDAIGFVKEHYQENISARDIALHAGISERYLRKIFAHHLSISPMDYLNQIRINKSIELLRLTSLSIKEVSFLCGFNSPQYFSRVFKQQTGSTPSEIIK